MCALLLAGAIALYQWLDLSGTPPGETLVLCGIAALFGIWFTGWGWIVCDRVLIGLVHLLCRAIAWIALVGLFGDELLSAFCEPEFEPCLRADFTRHYRMLAFLALWSAASAGALVLATKEPPGNPTKVEVHPDSA